MSKDLEGRLARLEAHSPDAAGVDWRPLWSAFMTPPAGRSAAGSTPGAAAPMSAEAAEVLRRVMASAERSRTAVPRRIAEELERSREAHRRGRDGR